MSIDFHLDVVDKIPLKEAALILINRIDMKPFETTDRMIQGAFCGGSASVFYFSERSKYLCHELYGVTPQTGISFRVDKFAPYAVSYGNIFDGIIALVKVTHQDAIAAIEDRPFLRRLNGQITLYNNGGLFDANVVPQWRPKFDFEHAFKELFER
jgi:hypothetical protein